VRYEPDPNTFSVPALATCPYCRQTVRVTESGRTAFHRTAFPRTIKTECPG